jgi:hypothetical protein
MILSTMAGLERLGPTWRQPLAHEGVELLREQHAGWAGFQRLDQVDADEVEALVVLLQIGARVLGPYFGPRVLERAPMHLGQMLLAEVDDFPVDIDHHRPAHARIPEHLAQGGPFTAPDHQPRFGPILRGEEARVDEALVVDEVLRLGRLDPAVEDQELAVGESVHDLGMLVLGLRLHDGPADGMRVAFDARGRLEEPLVVLLVDQLTATEALLTIGTDALRNMPRWTSTTEVRSAANCSTR